MFAYTKIMQAMSGAVAVVTDAYFNLVTLLLNTSSTNGAQNNTFLDSSTNNFTITRNGNTTQGTFTPFSQTGWGNYFDGTDDRLTTSSALLAYSTGNASTQTATIEAMVYLNAYNASKAGADENAAIVAKGSTYMNFGINHLGNLILYHYDGTVRTPTSSGTVPLNTWTHVAVTLSGGVATFYINGSSSGTGTWYGLAATSDPVYIGEATGASASAINGYLSNLRISTTARTITVPTAPYTSDANTALLTCQSNRFVDNSSNGYAVTVDTGTPSVQAFSPFLPTAAYDTAVVGGSGYFDGTGDYLTWTGTAAGSGAFSYEFWIYSANGFGTSRSPLGVISTSGYNSALEIRMSGTTINMSQYNVANNNFTVPALAANTWYHVVCCRNGSNQATVFLNGVRSSTGVATISTNFSGLTSAIGRLDSTNGGDVTGYIAGVRLITGSTPYDPTQTTITVPTAPPTAITNTSLLLNYTNAGIYDSAAKNVLETVGNAQVSTTQAKWGTTSMYFDGTGDYLKLPSNAIYAFNTGAYTIEFWIYPNSLAAGAYHVVGANATNGIIIAINNAKIALNKYGVGDVLAYNTALTTSVWTHVAIVREGTGANQTKIYVNGTSVATGTDSNDWSVTTNFGVGANTSDGSQGINAYLDDLRITKGYARYTSNFTAPTAAFPLQ